MNCRLRSLMLLAALPLCVAAMSQEAAAKDRFDVKIEVTGVYAFRDTVPSGRPVEYKYDFNAGIKGVDNYTINSRVKTLPQTYTKVLRGIYFRDIETPERDSRLIKMSAKMTGQYKILGQPQQQDLGDAVGSTSRDLFDEADDARDDVAWEVVAVRNGDYVLYVRVTVTEVD
jgi:hypothetical protein